jgi:predicted secreted hydrolase
VLPAAAAPHHRLTEWWYYTGHLKAADGRTFGFEDVIFRAERGAFPTSWVSHLAITDENGGRFLYSQRLETGPQVDRSPRAAGGAPTGFELAIAGDAATLGGAAQEPWTMAGGGGTDHLAATLSQGEATDAGSPGGLGLDLQLHATKPAALSRDAATHRNYAAQSFFSLERSGLGGNLAPIEPCAHIKDCLTQGQGRE